MIRKEELNRSTIVFLIGTFLLSGCGLMTNDAPYQERLNEAKEAVALARENVEAVKSLQLEEAVHRSCIRQAAGGCPSSHRNTGTV